MTTLDTFLLNVSQISNMITRVGDGDLERLDKSVKQNPNANTPPVRKRITPNPSFEKYQYLSNSEF